MSKTLLVKVMFPRTSPIVSKIFNIDTSLLVSKVISQIAEHVKSGLSLVNCGLFIPKYGVWLEEDKPLSKYVEMIKTAVPIVTIVIIEGLCGTQRHSRER